MEYEELLKIADSEGLIIKEKKLQSAKGRIKGNRIAINKELPTVEKACILAEELGHYYTTTGDILDQTLTENRKQECHARALAYDSMVGLVGIICAYKERCRSLQEIADKLNVSEEFFLEALEHYKKKYGSCVACDNYLIYFEPSLGVLEIR